MDISGPEATFYAAGGPVLSQLASMKLGGMAKQESILRTSPSIPLGECGQRSMP
jgi:hypothetical protein